MSFDITEDINYNVKITNSDGYDAFVFAQRLHNENLDHWQGWQCKAGVHSIYIYESEIYGGECRNDQLGHFGDWQMIKDWTVCQRERCGGCTTDLMQEKREIPKK